MITGFHIVMEVNIFSKLEDFEYIHSLWRHLYIIIS